MAHQQKPLRKIESNPTSFRPSSGLGQVLDALTPKQRAAIPRLVERDLVGASKEDLFKGASKICHRSVYFGNWVKNPIFTAALNMALLEARAATMESVVVDTVDQLRRIAPKAAADLERQIVGDDHALDALMRVANNGKRPVDERVAALISMGVIGTRRATDLLMLLLDDGDPTIRKEAAGAIGVSATGRDTARRLAAVAVLDRADRATANKGGTADEAHELSDDELERIAAGK